MTRAALLHILDHTTAIDAAEVRELEQLAQAFPYCQTAHLLLAKAAHDQGTMLASQRLRRAATYAADRELLRHLIEQVPEVAEPVMEEVPTPVVEAVSITEPAIMLPEPVIEAVAPVEEVRPLPVTVAPAAIIPPVVVPIILPENKPVAVEPAVESPPMAVITQAESPFAEAVPELLLAASPVVGEVATPEILVAETTLEIVEPTAVAEITPEPEAVALVAIPALPAVEIPVEVIAVEEVAEVEVPAAAPPIRPPEEIGSARFEFGLQEEPKPAAPIYELPGLVDEWAAAATTLALKAEDVAFELPVLAEIAAPKWTEAAFGGDATVGYALGEGSRLGFGLGLLAEALLANAEAAEGEMITTETIGAPAATALPPADEFFAPDALLLEHWATHRPPVVVTPSSLDLINNFLRRQPRLTRPAMLPPSPTAQTDLSVKSTRTEPELASESLARILARQGKTERAIEIYQRLMVKQPEKMAYFAAQIQQLQPSA
jgi:hypothetical protein